ncbi:uncharacterized protein LOC110984728 [Acanthaster planci]|uniref:Uncharacterized protein LOC110984728 n=1 Tax=Acanthaster planci TaxID=133434 RepID=A0A8B7Z7V8_ACAPL|nr:uncharacterized protein LOC110984728 [Acanthaster planci]XP_022100871.1 uncharacterized protein LOC110984728 [Acanthaster planci]XP_022100872.1 uncharacterized protein LOC110984728 [Acanthaster planci]XP_022100873.1 uncharacterized protein LOC110984728 [Acanthaster planci]XP_022100874.1 uncharacterized protein LOC110984728 [Acanthaster planci]XP_022100875.1 uncharacterized protein LOC110984728 [Acanthaster planci]XP_022100876.1 uncharacterized protein LOC110984728 [Acanthaster planci]XP_0
MMMATEDNSTTVLPPPPNRNGATGQPTSQDQATIPVAASAASLVLVLLAIVLWYFLVRGQLRKKHYEHKRTSSHHSHQSHQGSLRDCNSRHGSLASRCHGTPRASPHNHRKSANGSPRSKRSSRCTCQYEACTCPSVRSSDSPLLMHSPKSNRSSVTECTGTSPFCPHSRKFRLHKFDIHMRDSMDSDYHPDDENMPGPSNSNQNSKACTCSSDVIVNMDALVSSSGSQVNVETSDGRQPVNCDGAAVCSRIKPISQEEFAKHCTCRVIRNPLGNGRNSKRQSLNHSAPALIGSSSDSDFHAAEAL